MLIRASSLGVFNICPYKFKNDTFDGDPRVVYFGDVIHYAVRTDKEKAKQLLEYYNQINPDLQLKMIGEKMIDKLDEYISNLSKSYDLYFEVPFREFGNDYTLQGTPDIVAIHKETKDLLVLDIKTASSKSWYEGNSIRGESFQPVVYTYFAMKLFNKKRAKFRFVVLEKTNTANISEFEKEFTLEETQKKIEETINALITAEALNDYPAKECRYCHFCKLKGECPLYKIKTEEDENEF